MTREEMEDPERTSKSLETRLFRVKSGLLTCLEDGIDEVLEKMEGATKDTAHYLLTGGIGTALTQYEFNAYLLQLRDDLGYAMKLVSDLNVHLKTEVLDRIENLDRQLKQMLPLAIQRFRDADDDPTPYPENFPEFFWWRRIPHKVKTS